VVSLILAVAAVTLVTRLLTSTAQNPFVVTGLAAAAILATVLWRWKRLRV
jgi:hypothetical protein